MMYANEMIPGDVFHPAEILKDELDARKIKQSDLATLSNFNKSFISLLLQGKRNITIPVAVELEKVLGIKAEIWIRLQKQYELNNELIELKNLRKSA